MERKSSCLSPKLESFFLISVTVLGLVCRIRQFFYNKSMWLDELSLANQINNHSLVRLLFYPLGNKQVAPPGYLLGTKTSIALAGYGEFSIRALPFLASILFLAAGYFLVKNLFPVFGQNSFSCPF